MTTTTNKATIGSINVRASEESRSTGTLRSEDLLQAFADELERHDTDNVWLHRIDEARHMLDGSLKQDASNIINELQDALNEYAPPFCYFGTLEGDGADFGFWPDHEAIEELKRTSEVVGHTGPNGEQTLYNLFEQVMIVTNDHGNITISRIEPGEVLLSIV